jgi:hypothetical protein
MPLHSLLRQLHAAVFLLFATLPDLGSAWIDGTCSGDSFGPSILRMDLNSNVWASNSSLATQRGVLVWVGNQNWNSARNNHTVFYPILAVLSTSHNGTFISTSVTGSQIKPCPPSFTYDSYYDGSLYLNQYTFNSSMSCPGYYDLTTSAPIRWEDSKNFTGSPENSDTTAALAAVNTRYGLTSMNLVLPEYTLNSATSKSPGASISHYGTANFLYGWVQDHEEQVLGLGLNSTFINHLYNGKYISSRSLGLYYGVPAAAGAANERNGSIVLGGYSTSRLQGDFMEETYPIGQWNLERHCPWEIKVTSFATSSKTVSSQFTACVDPAETSLVLPSSMIDELSYSSGTNLTITLTNGLVVKVPASLVQIRAVDATDKSPILGAPFLSQVYLFADYQERALSTGLANNTFKYTVGYDQLACVEHSNSTGYIPWAIGNPTATSASPSSTTSLAPGSTETVWKNRAQASLSGGMYRYIIIVVLGACLLL